MCDVPPPAPRGRVVYEGSPLRVPYRRPVNANSFRKTMFFGSYIESYIKSYIIYHIYYIIYNIYCILYIIY